MIIDVRSTQFQIQLTTRSHNEFAKMVSKDGIELSGVKIDKDNIGQLASTLVAALTSKSTRFRLRSKDLADVLRVGTTWSNDAVIVGIQDFVILAETGAKVRRPMHIDLLREVCLSRPTLESMDPISLTMTIAHCTRLILDSAYVTANEEHRNQVSARQLIKQLIGDAIPMIFLKGVNNNV